MTDTTTGQVRQRNRPLYQSYIALLKPRVMSLSVFTAAAGMAVAPVSVAPPAAIASIALIALGAGAAGALNMWWDADIDAVMRRTRNRPVPDGRLPGAAALWFGLVLSVLAVMGLALVANVLAGALLAFTIFFYAVIYSMILKRRTPQNIVIGGAAGAFPPMIGWVAATGAIGPEAVAMFALIFLWTPPHFWALALFMNDDYTRAGVPMLTVTHGKRHTRNQIFVYACVLAAIAVPLSLSSIGGPIYLVSALWLNAAFVLGAWRIRQRDDRAAEADRYAAERRYFRLSMVYLFVHFAALWADAILRGAGLGPWQGWPALF